jgi:hypothetical protein
MVETMFLGLEGGGQRRVVDLKKMEHHQLGDLVVYVYGTTPGGASHTILVCVQHWSKERANNEGMNHQTTVA